MLTGSARALRRRAWPLPPSVGRRSREPCRARRECAGARAERLDDEAKGFARKRRDRAPRLRDRGLGLRDRGWAPEIDVSAGAAAADDSKDPSWDTPGSVRARASRCATG